MSQFAAQYRDFFAESEAGLALMKDIESLIEAEHKEAENTDDPMTSFGHMKQAAGVRLAIGKIKNLQMEARKPRT